MTGSFVVIEGIDGAGTTTQSKLLENWLEDKGRSAVLTHEPLKKEGHIGKVIREHLIQEDEDHSPEAIALAFAADRLVHLEERIIPALERNRIVISDRYYHSSLTFQSVHGVDLNWIKEINKHAKKPDLTIIIDVPAKESIERLEEREGNSGVVFEELDFESKVRERYRELEEELDENLYLIDGDRSKEEVHKDIKEIVGKEILEG